MIPLDNARRAGETSPAMLAAVFELGQRADLVLLVVGLGLLYVASRAAVDALVADADASPGWRAVGHHLPIGAVALAAVIAHEPGMAVGVLFGASVASLSLGCGALAASSELPIEAPGTWRRVWPFVIVVAVLAMLAGLSGTLTWVHAGVFLVEGIVLWLAWGNEPTTARRTRPLMLSLAILLAAVGAWAAVRGAVDLSREARAVTAGTIAATMMGPMLVLPMLGSGTSLAARGLSGAAVTTQVGVVLLNLCLWLPIVIGITHLQELYPRLAAATPATTLPTTQPTTTPTATQPTADDDLPAGGLPKPTLVFPLIVWRVDTIVLLVLGLILLPAALSRWPLGKRDGVVMLFVYAAYLMVVAAAGRR